jgi:mannosyltransferase OCH1-like enzyme
MRNYVSIENFRAEAKAKRYSIQTKHSKQQMLVNRPSQKTIQTIIHLTHSSQYPANNPAHKVLADAMLYIAQIPHDYQNCEVHKCIDETTVY